MVWLESKVKNIITLLNFIFFILGEVLKFINWQRCFWSAKYFFLGSSVQTYLLGKPANGCEGKSDKLL